MCIIIVNVHQLIGHCLIPLDPWIITNYINFRNIGIAILCIFVTTLITLGSWRGSAYVMMCVLLTCIDVSGISIYLIVYLSIHLSIYLTLYTWRGSAYVMMCVLLTCIDVSGIPIYLSNCLSINPFTYLYVYLSDTLSLEG